MNKAQKTYATCRDHIIKSLDRASGDDQNLDAITYANEEKGPFDTSLLDIASMMQDAKIQAAFRKYVSDQIGTFQYFEDV
jgi:hypothetical protein